MVVADLASQLQGWSACVCTFAPCLVWSFLSFLSCLHGWLGWACRDDMPAIGYARSSLSHDRIEQFLLLLYGTNSFVSEFVLL